MSIKIMIMMAVLLSSVYAQENNENTEFHRLLISNEKNELLVVKIKNTDFWVTPGLYAVHNDSINNKLHQLAEDYGLTLTALTLRGQFQLKNKKTQVVLNRHFYRAHVNQYMPKIPDNIDSIRWLPFVEAMKLMTFPHIKLLTKQVIDYPDLLWAGTVLRYKKDHEYKAEIVEPFYQLRPQHKHDHE